MMQAVSLESTPAPVKPRSGSNNDPAEGVFAGLMAQASVPAALPASNTAPAPDTQRQDRVESRTDARPESTSVSRKDTSRSEEAARTDRRAAADSSEEAQGTDSAKDAVNRSPSEASKTSEGTDQDPASAKPASTASGTAKTDETSQAGKTIVLQQTVEGTIPTPASAANEKNAAAVQGTPDLSASIIKVAIPLGKTEADPTVKQAESDAPATESTPGKEAAGKTILAPQTPASASTAPAKPALTELLSIPKVEIQTPKWNPDATKITADDSKKAIPAGTEKTSINLKPDAAPSPAAASAQDADAKSASAKFTLPMEEAAKAATRMEDASHSTAPKAASPLVEPMMAVQGEGLRASSAAARADAPAMIRQSPVLAQVDGSIRWILQNKVQAAELQLHPDSLGKVIIQLRVEGQDVHARLWASESTSMAVLQDHKNLLESSLKEQGLNLSSFDLQSGARGDSAQTAFQHENPTALPREIPRLEIKQEMPTENAQVSLGAHQIEVYA